MKTKKNNYKQRTLLTKEIMLKMKKLLKLCKQDGVIDIQLVGINNDGRVSGFNTKFEKRKF